MKRLNIPLFILTLLLNINVFSQVLHQDSLPFSSNIFHVKNQTSQIRFMGYYRFMGFIRHQSQTFPSNSGKTTAILVGDSYREPMLLLKMRGITSDKISFGADFMINSLYKGVSADLIKPLTLELGLNLRTSIPTKYGNFNILKLR